MVQSSTSTESFQTAMVAKMRQPTSHPRMMLNSIATFIVALAIGIALDIILIVLFGIRVRGTIALPLGLIGAPAGLFIDWPTIIRRFRRRGIDPDPPDLDRHAVKMAWRKRGIECIILATTTEVFVLLLISAIIRSNPNLEMWRIIVVYGLFHILPLALLSRGIWNMRRKI